MFLLLLLAIFFNTLIMIIEIIRRENVTVISVLLKCAFKYYQKCYDRHHLGKALDVFLQVSHAMIMVPRYFSTRQNSNS